MKCHQKWTAITATHRLLAHIIFALRVPYFPPPKTTTEESFLLIAIVSIPLCSQHIFFLSTLHPFSTLKIMSVFLFFLLLFLAMSAPSNATYCICKDGVSDSLLQKNIDYACGAGADCSQILQNGPCYNPNTAKDHCNYAVNSFFQKKGQAAGSCDFSGTATVSQNPPSSQNSACVYPSSGSSMGTSPSTNTPSTTPGFSNPTNAPPTTTNTTPATTNPIFGVQPTGSGGVTSTDNGASLAPNRSGKLLSCFAIALLLSGLMV